MVLCAFPLPLSFAPTSCPLRLAALVLSQLLSSDASTASEPSSSSSSSITCRAHELSFLLHCSSKGLPHALWSYACIYRSIQL